jgi:hypothetical protein
VYYAQDLGWMSEESKRGVSLEGRRKGRGLSCRYQKQKSTDTKQLAFEIQCKKKSRNQEIKIMPITVARHFVLIIPRENFAYGAFPRYSLMFC